MNEAQFRQQMETACHAAEARLAEFFTQQGLQEAMRYSLMAGGKRIRPILTMQFCPGPPGARRSRGWTLAAALKCCTPIL